jgi:hypothetical protein
MPLVAFATPGRLASLATGHPRPSRAAWTSAPTSRLSCSASGCHCTPILNFARESSRASRVRRWPRPTGRTRARCDGLMVIALHRRARSEDAEDAAPGRRPRHEIQTPSAGAWSWCGTQSGTCRSRWPPSATAMTCRRPRQRQLEDAAVGPRRHGPRERCGDTAERPNYAASGGSALRWSRVAAGVLCGATKVGWRAPPRFAPSPPSLAARRKKRRKIWLADVENAGSAPSLG